MSSTTVKLTIATVGIAASLLVAAQAAFAQSCNLSGTSSTSLRNPLIWGAPNSAAFQPAAEGQAPAMGDGAVPAPVTRGMGGGPTLLPTNNWNAPSINQGSYQTPFSTATESAPGTLGPSMYVPAPPSTPGYDPGLIQSKQDFYAPGASVVNVMPGGGISGSASTQRWGGQTTADFGRYKYSGTRKYDFGYQAYGQTSQDGTNQTRAGATSTTDLYGRRMRTNYGMQNTQTIAPY